MRTGPAMRTLCGSSALILLFVGCLQAAELTGDIISNLTLTSVTATRVTLEWMEKGDRKDIGSYVVSISNDTCVVIQRGANCSQPLGAELCENRKLSTTPISTPSTTTPRHAIVSTPSSELPTTAIPGTVNTPPVSPPSSTTTTAIPGTVNTPPVSRPPQLTVGTPGTEASSTVTKPWSVIMAILSILRTPQSITVPARERGPKMVAGLAIQPDAEDRKPDASGRNVSGGRRRRIARSDGVHLRQANIAELQPATAYRLTVSPFFCNGSATGEEKSVHAMTAGFVTDVKVTSHGTMTVVEWKSPVAGLEVHSATLVDAVPADTGSSLCSTHTHNRIIELTHCNSSQCWGSNPLSGFWEYNVTVTVNTTYGLFDSQPFPVTTQPKTPGRVPRSSLAVFTWSDKTTCEGRQPTNRSILCVTWQEICPRDRNSWIRIYVVSLTSRRQKMKWKKLRSMLSAPDASAYRRNSTVLNYQLPLSATPGHSYEITITAVNTNGQAGWSASKSFHVRDVSPPAVPDERQVLNELVPRRYVTSSRNTIQFRLESTRFLVLDADGHCVDHVLIITAGGREPADDNTPFRYPGYASRSEALNHGGYRVNDDSLDKLPRCRHWTATDDRHLTVTIGDEGNCSSGTKPYCDGPLDADKSYSIWVKLCNEAHCSSLVLVRDQPMLGFDAATSAVYSPWYWAFIILPIIAFFGVFLLFGKPSMNCGRRRSSTLTQFPLSTRFRKGHLTKCPMKLVTLESVISHKLRDEGLQLREEFEDLVDKTRHNSPAEDESWLELNRAKNRYADILACNHSRVKLSRDANGSDYINANFIPGYTGQNEYVATQGPITSTVSDFWRMVWEHRVPIIVMLTQFVEQGRMKCVQYWPKEDGETGEYQNIKVTKTSVTQLCDYTITIFAVSCNECEDQPLEVYHFHYLTWPDMTADITPHAMIDFLSAVRQRVKLSDTQSGPIVVHCSAGVGRTGTYIAIDYAMQFIDQRPLTDQLDVYSFVEKLRQFRCKMVQTEAQYIFIHQCARFLMAMRPRREGEVTGNGGGDARAPSSSATYRPLGENGVKGGSQLSVAKGDLRELAAEPSDMDTVELDTSDAWQNHLQDVPETADPPLATSSTENLCVV